MKTHVVSLEIAKQLQEASWTKPTIFSWCITPGGEWIILPGLKHENSYIENATAIYTPLATEILEELPEKIKIHKSVCGNWQVEVKNIIIKDFTLPNALADMWYVLKKESLL